MLARNDPKTKFISAVASLALVVGLMPLPAFADAADRFVTTPDEPAAYGLTVTVNPEPGADEITLSVQGNTEIYVTVWAPGHDGIHGRTFTIPAEPADYVENVKAKIEDKTGFSPQQQVLFIREKVMRDGHTLAEYNVPERYATLILCLREPSYTVTLDPGAGCGASIAYRSTDQSDFPDMGDAGNCQFAYVDVGEIGSGCVGFYLDDEYCPNSFTAPRGCVFDGWEGYPENYYVFPDGGTEVTFTAKWKRSGDISGYGAYGLINDIAPVDGGYIWMGSARNPMRWHIIGENSSNYLLISADVQGEMSWSNALSFCEALFTSSFTDVEQAAVPVTSKTEPSDYQYTSYSGDCFEPSSVDGTMFLLSADEAEAYFISNADRQPGGWWLRSPYSFSEAALDFYAGVVSLNGGVYYHKEGASFGDFIGARPAFQLTRASVLFESLAEGGKPEADSGFGAYTQPTAAQDRKLTLLDSSRSSFVANVACTEVAHGDSLAITYGGVASGDYVSAMLCDGDGAAQYYASLTPDSSGSGTWDLEISDVVSGGSYTLMVFSEQRNGDKKTDYASVPVAVEVTIPDYVVTVNGGTGSGIYMPGDSITITANEPESGKVFKEWTGADGLSFTSGNTRTDVATFVMPTSNVTLTAACDGCYMISNYEELKAFAAYVNDGQYGYGDMRANARLTADIVATDEDWTPINILGGTFDGCGFTITGLHVSEEPIVQGSDTKGMFNWIYERDFSNLHGVVRNLALKDVYVEGGSYGGGIAGMNFGGTVYNCYVTGAVSGTEYSGGVVGQNTGFVQCCYSIAEVPEGSGGVIGSNSGDARYCYYDSDVVNTANAIHRGGGAATNVMGLHTEQMTGAAARNNMTGFAFGTTWFVTASYPSLKKSDATVEHTVTYRVVGGTWADGSMEDKTEPVGHGNKPASVPTGMVASEGFTGGAWDSEPADTAITEDTTFTYTFDEDISSYGANALINGIPPRDGGYIWMGSEGDPVRWHVIGANGSNYLLISADVLGYKTTWNDARNYCRTLFTSSFTDVEQAAVPVTSKSEPDDYRYVSNSGHEFGPESVNGNMFVLSVEEAETYFVDDSARQPGWWWLRSHDYVSMLSAGAVDGDGGVEDYFVNIDNISLGTRPAFQLNRASVLLESAAEGGKPEADSGFGAYMEPTAETDRKLTLLDSSRSGFTAEAANASVIPGGTVSLSYSGAGSSDATVTNNYNTGAVGDGGSVECVSAMLCDGDGTALYYASVTLNSSGIGGVIPYSNGTGTWDLVIPGDFAEGSYTLKVFSEQRNGDKKTDYASAPVSIDLTVSGNPAETYTVTYRVVGGTWADGSTEDKTEPVGHGNKPANVPTGMAASEGFMGGAWDSEPADTAITKDTAFTYTFVKNGAPDYTVKFDANVPANASTTCSGSMEDERFAYDERKALSANGYVLPGYDFGGWNTKADGTGASFADKAEVQGLADGGGTVALYAQWSAKEYTITFEPGDVTGEPHVQTARFDQSGTLDAYSDAAFGWNHGGKVLHGWAGAGLGSFFDDGEVFCNLCGEPDADGSLADAVLTADWVQIGQIVVTVTKDGTPQTGLEDCFLLDNGETTFTVPAKYENGKYVFDATKATPVGGQPAQLPQDSYEIKLSALGYPPNYARIEYNSDMPASVVFGYYTVSLAKDAAHADANEVEIDGGEGNTVIARDGDMLIIRTAVSEGYRFCEYTAVGVTPVWEGGDPTKAAQAIVVQGTAAISAHVSPIEYSVTIEGGKADRTTATIGETVSITADAPEAGKAFVQWAHVDDVKYGDASSASTTFAMPAKDVTVEAVFAPIVIGTIGGKVYTGGPIEPSDEVAVSLDGVDLVLTTDDYEVSFEDNVDAGDAKVIVTMKNPRAGSATSTFKITPADISEAEVTAAGQVYDGTEKKPTPTVTWKGRTLGADKDYEVSAYADNVHAGSATVTVAGKGNFANTAGGSFEIAKRTVSVSVADKISEYDGSKQYGKAAPSFSNVVPGHTATITYTPANGTLVGEYDDGSFGTDFGVTDAGGGDVTGNYALAGKTAGKLAIGPAAATIKVDGASKVAGETDPAFTGKVEGLVKAGDLGEIAYERTNADVEAPGTYAGVLTATYTANANYEVTVMPGDFTIEAAPEPEPEPADKTALGEGAAACAAALASAIVSADGSDVDPADKWVTQADADALEAAIAAARTVLSDEGATQAQVDAATAQLAAALGRFEASKRPGTKPEPEPQVWERIAGETALDTMSAVVDAGGFPKGGTVVLASLEGYWDALAAAGIAGLEGAPVLMVPEGFLGAQAAAQLAKLAPAKIIACGGTDWIPALTIEQAVAAAGTGPEVVRLAGDVAVGTAEEIAKAGAGRWSGTAIVATVGTFQDALAAAPLSYAKAMPVFFAQYDFSEGAGSLAQSTIDSMKASGISRAYVAGGAYWLPASVEDQLEAAGIQVVKRLAGATAVETSAAIAEEAVTALGMTADGMGVADISQHYDALASAAFCGKANTVLALALDERSSVIGGFVKSHAADISRGYVFGGPASVSDATLAALEAATG